MALQFTTANVQHCDFGSAAVIDDVIPVTGLLLMRADAFTAGAHLLAKKSDSTGGTPGWRLTMSAAAGAIAFNRRYSTDNQNYISGNNIAAPLGTWRWIAFSFDAAAAGGLKVKLYGGPYLGSIAEATSYSTAIDAVGTLINDNTLTLRIGHSNTAAATTTPSAAFERMALWSSVLSMAQLQAHIDGTQHTAGLLIDAKLGWAGGTLGDDIYTNNLDGTTTGATNTAGVQEVGGTPASTIKLAGGLQTLSGGMA